MTFEESIEKVIDEYGAPEPITQEIKNFLLDSGNIYTIIEIYKEYAIKNLRKQNE